MKEEYTSDPNLCPDCNIKLEQSHVSDVDSGDVLLSAWVEYCPECLYINSSDVKLSK